MNSIETKNALISVIVPVHNSASFVKTSLKSLFDQNYKNLEIIAIDDNSTDNSFSLLKNFKRHQKSIKIYRNVKKYGLAVTLNRCIKRARGKFIVFMDSRDMVTKNKFQKQLEFLLRNPKVVAVGTQCVYLSEDNKRIGKSSYPQNHEIIAQTPLHGVSMLFEGVMINRYKIPKDLLYFPTNKHFFLYSDMAIKLMQFGELANLPEYLHFHRKHDTSLQNITKRASSLMKLWMASKFDYDIDPISLKNLFSTFFKVTTS